MSIFEFHAAALFDGFNMFQTPVGPNPLGRGRIEQFYMGKAYQGSSIW